MINCNPMYYLRHAWSATNSKWGKACIVLFYWFLWINILGALYFVLVDSTTGWECFYDALGEGSPNVKNFTIGTIKVVNLWALGFLLYADRGGIKVWNVAMVWFVFLVVWLLFQPVITDFAKATCPDDLAQLKVTMLGTQIWISLALLCAFMEGRYTSTASREASTPLR